MKKEEQKSHLQVFFSFVDKVMFVLFIVLILTSITHHRMEIAFWQGLAFMWFCVTRMQEGLINHQRMHLRELAKFIEEIFEMLKKEPKK